MCSVDEVDGWKVEDKSLAKIEGNCKRCSEKAVLVRGIDPLCLPCFQSYFIHKFRSTLGKSHQVKTGEKVLIAYSGGASSSAMVHMIKEGLKEESHKKLIFFPVLLFINDGAIFLNETEDWKEMTIQIYNTMLDFEFPCYVTHLEMAYRKGNDKFYSPLDSNNISYPVCNNEKEKKCLREALESFKSLTSKEDFIKHLRFRLISDIAVSLGCTKVFVGDSATWLAVQLLAGLAQGQGAHLNDDIGFKNARYSVPILRPMREFLQNEISMYNHFNKVPFTIKPTLSTKTENKSSILRLTENFVVNLQSQFPSTVPTIFRTGDKLCSDPLKISEKKCVICQSHIDTVDAEECTALKALSLSEKLSQKLPNSPLMSTESECCSLKANCCRNGKSLDLSEFRNELFSYLCYSCQIIVKDMGDPNLLPSAAVLEIKHQMARCKMKEEIKEFLLEDDSNS